ncbi:MAG: CvpA family protein [Chloroflexota bacterium]
MNVTEFLSSVNLTDVLVVLVLFGFFVLGFIQGTVRRVVGILSIVFSFFLAAQLHVPLGDFLGDNWNQFPREYAAMIGFLTVFAAAVIAFSLVIQGTYKKAPLFAKYPVIDEVIGGVLGVIQGLLLLMFVILILDQFFLLTNFPVDEDELPFLRDFWNTINTSGTGDLLHTQLIPNFVSLTSFLLPDTIKQLYAIT